MNPRPRHVIRTVAIAALAAVAGTVAAGVWFVLSHRDSTAVSRVAAEAEFAQLRGRFAGATPLVDMATRRVDRVAEDRLPAGNLHTVHTVIFDTRGQSRLVQISVPYWVATKYAARGEFKWLGQLTFLDDTEFDSEAIQLSLNALERRGPGLLVDHSHPSGGQFLSWVD
jgi:hypothetical protein